MATKKETTKKPAAKKAAAPKKATTAKKSTAKKVEKIVDQTAPQHIGLVRNDSWLEPFEGAIRGRHDHALWKIGQLTQNGKKKLSDFASGHLYFGLHKLPKGWVFREWAPNATDIYLIGDFNGCSVGGLLMLQTSICLVTSTTGKKMRSIVASAFRVLATGN